MSTSDLFVNPRREQPPEGLGLVYRGAGSGYACPDVGRNFAGATAETNSPRISLSAGFMPWMGSSGTLRSEPHRLQRFEQQDSQTGRTLLRLSADGVRRGGCTEA